MKTLIIVMLVLSSFAFAEKYQCKNYEMQAPDSVSSIFNIDINVEKEEAKLDLQGEIEKMRLHVTPDSMVLVAGSGADRFEIHIITNEKFNVIENFVNFTAQEYDLSLEDKEIFAKKVRKTLGDKNINGTLVILDQVQGFLSCQKK